MSNASSESAPPERPAWLPPLPEGSALADTVHIVPREEWGARSPTDVTPYCNLPCFIRFIQTDSDEACCIDDDSCKKELRELQKKHISDGFPDIRYNFMIGAGGTIYEGRGWKTDLELHNKLRAIQGKCLDIAYMGDHKYESPPWDMLVSAFNLLLYGVNNKLLSPFFDFQHLQTEDNNEKNPLKL